MERVTITYLQMLSPAALKPSRHQNPYFSVVELTPPVWQRNRDLYWAVGNDWSWTDKRAWSDAQWKTYVESDRLLTCVGKHREVDAGYFELRGDDAGGVEIVIFGLLPAFIGRGLGGLLLTEALRRAWALNPNRVWLHTCTLDHPRALANYLARGMEVHRADTVAPSTS